MEVGRAELCVSWWVEKGGRELVLFGQKNGGGHRDDIDEGEKREEGESK